MDPHAELVDAVERVVRFRRTRPRGYGYSRTVYDPRWPLNSQTPHNTLRGYLLQTTAWKALGSRLGRRPYHGETTRAIDAVLVVLALEDP